MAEGLVTISTDPDWEGQKGRFTRQRFTSTSAELCKRGASLYVYGASRPYSGGKTKRLLVSSSASSSDNSSSLMDCKRASAVEIKSSTSGPMYMMMDQWRIVLTGFGKFTVRKKEPRTGRNPRTGEAIIVSGHKVVTFVRVLYGKPN